MLVKIIVGAALAMSAVACHAVSTDVARAGYVDRDYTVKSYRYDEWFNIEGEMLVCPDDKRKNCVDVRHSVPRGFIYQGWKVEAGILYVLMKRQGAM